MDKLLPCPFCGGEAEVLRSWTGKKWYWPSCVNPSVAICPGRTDEQDEQGGTHLDRNTKEEAIALWNTRTPTTEAK